MATCIVDSVLHLFTISFNIVIGEKLQSCLDIFSKSYSEIALDVHGNGKITYIPLYVNYIPRSNLSSKLAH